MLAFLGPIGLFLKIGMSLLGGGGIQGIVQTVTSHLDKLNDNETKKFEIGVGAEKEVKIAELQAGAQSWHDRVDLLKGLKLTSFLIAMALIPPLYHQAGVFLDSCPFFIAPWFDGWYFHIVLPHKIGSWNFVKLPPPYDEREWQLIASLLGIQTTAATIMGAVRYLKR